jgi:hypothetical protein
VIEPQTIYSKLYFGLNVTKTLNIRNFYYLLGMSDIDGEKSDIDGEKDV